MPDYSAQTIRGQFPRMLEKPVCDRCKGLLITEELVDFLSDTGPVVLPVQRCIQCGAVTDPVILLNRACPRAVRPRSGARARAIRDDTLVSRSTS